jgi:hypothetical protein
VSKISNAFTGITALVLLALASGAAAHHSRVAFDESKLVTITGEVTRLAWRNPHIAINVEVSDGSGGTELWKIEGLPIAQMDGHGLDKNSISVGDQITVDARPLKTGRPGGLLMGVTLASGAKFVFEDTYNPSDVQGRSAAIPALVDYVPPPEGESWQERERKTRPAQLPLVGSSPRQTGPGALDPEHLAKNWPEPAFDLTGTWAFRGENEWRANYGSYEFKPHPEWTEKTEMSYGEFLENARAGRRVNEPTARCYPAGMPRLMNRYGSLMILQYPTAIFMVSRLNNEYRAIWMDGRAPEPEEHRDRNWNGESIGHWDGDTLVVETTGFIDNNHLIQAGIETGDQLKIIERIQMINDGNTMVSEYIMTDPEHWVGEWRHVKFRDRILNADVREATCLAEDNLLLPGM